MPRAEGPARPTAARGLALIEVLVALLLVSLGLLAMARLTGRSVSQQKAAQLALTATTLAHDHAERARLNLYGFDLGGYDLTADDTLAAPPPLDPDADDRTAALALASTDRQTLLTRLAQDLPDSAARAVSHADPSARTLDIWLLWRDPPAGPDAALDAAAGRACPPDLGETERRGRRCLHWRVGL